MRLLTGIAAAIAALLDAILGLFRRDDPTARLDDLEAQVREEIAQVDRPMFEHDDEPDLARGPKVSDADRGIVPNARGFLMGDNTGFSRLPMRAKAWLILAADRGLVVEDATDRDLSAWLSGSAEHPRVPSSAVMAVARGEHPPVEATMTADEARWSPGLSPAF